MDYSVSLWHIFETLWLKWKLIVVFIIWYFSSQLLSFWHWLYRLVLIHMLSLKWPKLQVQSDRMVLLWSIYIGQTLGQDLTGTRDTVPVAAAAGVVVQVQKPTHKKQTVKMKYKACAGSANKLYLLVYWENEYSMCLKSQKL